MNKISAEEILKTEYSVEFDQLRKNRMIASFYKYGPLKKNYGDKLIDAIKSLKMCIAKYNDTGNTEYLLDAGNYCMIEFMHPQHPKAHFMDTGLSYYGNKLIDAIESLEKCIEKYKETGNIEYLLDAGNYCMIEFMHPKHSSAHFRATDSGDSAGIVGMSINEIKNFDK